MKYIIEDFDMDCIDEAAQLLQENHMEQFRVLEIDHRLSLDNCRTLIHSELERGDCRALMVRSDDVLLSYAIPVIRRDNLWGDSGWINLGGWCIRSGWSVLFPLLYQRIAEDWVNAGILEHFFMAFDTDSVDVTMFSEMGFSRQQTHAVLVLNRLGDIQLSSGEYSIRKAAAHDQKSIAGFSRLIAGYQRQSPCFAFTPPDYLSALDRGFSDLTEDPEVDLYVAQHETGIVAYQGYYKVEQTGLLTPPSTVELAVSAVVEDHRGRGCGLALTKDALYSQKNLKNNYAVTDWRCANLSSGPFWRKIGFRPAAHRYMRDIPEQ